LISIKIDRVDTPIVILITILSRVLLCVPPALLIRMSMFAPNNLLALSAAALVASGFPRSTGRTLNNS
jgi:hypothetical protein